MAENINKEPKKKHNFSFLLFVVVFFFISCDGHIRMREHIYICVSHSSHSNSSTVLAPSQPSIHELFVHRNKNKNKRSFHTSIHDEWVCVRVLGSFFEATPYYPAATAYGKRNQIGNSNNNNANHQTFILSLFITLFHSFLCLMWPTLAIHITYHVFWFNNFPSFQCSGQNDRLDFPITIIDVHVTMQWWQNQSICSLRPITAWIFSTFIPFRVPS